MRQGCFLLADTDGSMHVHVTEQFCVEQRKGYLSIVEFAEVYLLHCNYGPRDNTCLLKLTDTQEDAYSLFALPLVYQLQLATYEMPKDVCLHTQQDAYSLFCAVGLSATACD